MDTKIFRIYETIITILIGILLILTAAIQQYILSVLVLIAGMAIIYIYKRRSKTEDERIVKISEKASRRTLQIFGVGMAIAGFVLMYLYEYKPFGFALVYSSFILWAVYLVFYDYYLKKYGE
jgi:uncharacterized membrane protein